MLISDTLSNKTFFSALGTL